MDTNVELQFTIEFIPLLGKTPIVPGTKKLSSSTVFSRSWWKSIMNKDGMSESYVNLHIEMHFSNQYKLIGLIIP